MHTNVHTDNGERVLKCIQMYIQTTVNDYQMHTNVDTDQGKRLQKCTQMYIQTRVHDCRNAYKCNAHTDKGERL